MSTVPSRSRPPRLLLETPVTYLKGVGPARAEALKRLGVLTAGDLLFHIPHRYEDASTIAPISSLETGMQGTVIGRVISKGVIPTRRGLRIFQAVLRDDSGMIEVAWPGQPYLDRTINKGDAARVRRRAVLSRPATPAARFINLGEDEGPHGRILSVSGHRGLCSRSSDPSSGASRWAHRARRYLRAVLAAGFGPGIRDALRMVRGASLAEAMEPIAARVPGAVRVQMRSGQTLARQTRDLFEQARSHVTPARDCPTVTGASPGVARDLRTCAEIGASPAAQGDVGSGKTIVALFRLAMENGYEAALMVQSSCSRSLACEDLHGAAGAARHRAGARDGSLSVKIETGR
jgi:ATP-dependent DNA helicase RecG